MPDLRRKFARLLHRPRTCPGCRVEIYAVDVCDTCVERLPRPLRQAFYTARALRKGDHDGYRVALVRVRRWLTTNPVETQTNAKETSS